MGEESFADKVNKAFHDGFNSNPNFSKALKEIEEVLEAEERNNSKEAEQVHSSKNREDDEGR